MVIVAFFIFFWGSVDREIFKVKTLFSSLSGIVQMGPKAKGVSAVSNMILAISMFL